MVIGNGSVYKVSGYLLFFIFFFHICFKCFFRAAGSRLVGISYSYEILATIICLPRVSIIRNNYCNNKQRECMEIQ